MNFSLILLTYKPSFENIKRTLDSFLSQDFNDFEIIISDDGSDVFPINEVNSYFEEHHFTNYQLILNKNNQGTVKNCLSGLSAAKSNYVKLIGAGDLLYNKNSLNLMYNHLNNTGSEIAFGLMKSFYVDENGEYVFLKELFAPRFLIPYISENYKEIRTQILFCRDYISGASMFGQKDVFIDYLNQLKDKVIYVEDLLQVLVVLNNKPLVFLNEPLVYYEVNSGISTSGEQAANNRMQKDNDAFWQYVKSVTNDRKVIRYINNYVILKRINSRLIRNVFRLFFMPIVFWKKKKTRCLLECKENGFLES